MRKSVHATTLLIIVALIVMSFNGIRIGSCQSESGSFVTGPFVDEIIFKVIKNPEQSFLALQKGEIEMDTYLWNPAYISMLTKDPAISLFQGIRNGYGHLTINCGKYPLNISGLRRAFAFAFNKTRVTEFTLEGFGIEHDSLVPLPNSWCVEDQFDWHYYTAQPEIGNQILDDLNFTINTDTGFRNAPDGSQFEIVILYGAPGQSCSLSVPIIAVEALNSLYINASARAADFPDYISRLDSHGDYDMVFHGVQFYDNDVDWLAYEYWSENADVDYQNPTNFRNETYDGWRNQLLHGTTFEEVYEAAAEMQKILHYNVPRLVAYENINLQAYRNDVFTGHIDDIGKNIAGQWTLRNIHKIDGSLGGSVPIAIGEEPDSFNFFVTDSQYSDAILTNLWPSLYKYGPDLNPCPDLAKNTLTETHSDNPAVPDGHTRFTIDIIQNATWSDGVPVSAADVVFTIAYACESELYGNPAINDLGDLFAAYAVTPFRVIIEFTTESYWHFSDFAYDYIIPEHIFNNDTAIGYDEWNTWNPVFDPAEPHVTCGPFIFTDFEAGEYYKIERNPLFHYAASIGIPTNTTSNTTSSPGTSLQEMNWSTVVLTLVGTGSGIVIMYCTIVIIRERRNLEDI